MKVMIFLCMALSMSTVQKATAQSGEGKDYYVSQNLGKGRVASKEQPAKDLGALISILKAGDRVHVAQGIYVSKAGRGSDIIEVPISIIGGYNDKFTSRDPWGAHQTIFSGINDYNASETMERISIQTDKKFRTWNGTIVVDGIIIDNAQRNRYKDDSKNIIIRKASPSAGRSATPGLAGLKVKTGAETNVEIRNCIVTNVASSQGALEVQIGRDGIATIENNLLVNNTGEGIYCKTNYHGSSNMSTFNVKNNTVLFSWKYDAIASYGGSCIMVDSSPKIVAEDNVFGFAHMGAVNNVKKNTHLTLLNNLIFGSTKFDYREFNTDLKLSDMEDYAEFLDPASAGNYSKVVELPLEKSWAENYFGRSTLSRAEVDAAATVSSSNANDWRSILGLPLQGSTVSKDVDVFLPMISLEQVLALGAGKIEGKGCSAEVIQ